MSRALWPAYDSCHTAWRGGGRSSSVYRSGLVSPHSQPADGRHGPTPDLRSWRSIPLAPRTCSQESRTEQQVGAAPGQHPGGHVHHRWHIHHVCDVGAAFADAHTCSGFAHTGTSVSSFGKHCFMEERVMAGAADRKTGPIREMPPAPSMIHCGLPLLLPMIEAMRPQPPRASHVVPLHGQDRTATGPRRPAGVDLSICSQRVKTEIVRRRPDGLLAIRAVGPILRWVTDSIAHALEASVTVVFFYAAECGLVTYGPDRAINRGAVLACATHTALRASAP